MEQNKKVDVIIPIYNAFDFTKKCIETVIENTDLKKHTLVLVNDKSPDEKILPMLKEFVENNKDINMVLIDNEENYGFVKTVNIGMKHSKNDVILLNSDTEVTKNWLDKMQKVAYVRENVATVTPLSNNATLASIPNFLEENALPNYVTVEEYAKNIEDCSFNEYPELTTAHGFCMYIRRDAIEKVGLFDDVTFEKGYGEENDFSYRCVNNGLVNLMCDNTFIYHKGTQSFTEKKMALIESHLKTLQEKYPDNFGMNTQMCMTNPYLYIQNNTKYSINNKYRKNVLIVVQEFLKKENKLLGGTVLHIYDLIESLRDKMNFHVLFPENGKYRIRSFFEDSTAEVILGSVTDYSTSKLYNYEYRKMVEKVFDFINIDFVHVHHVMYHYFDIFDIIKGKNIPYIVSLHDFYFVCPNYVLLENNEKYCGDIENPNCNECLKKTRKIEGGFVDTWRKVAYKSLKDAKQLIAPTESAKEIFNKYYKDLKITVIEHGMDYKDIEYEKQEKTEKRNIAFVGGINKVKGFDFLRKFIDKVNEEGSSYNLHLFGSTCDGELNKTIGNYIYHGKYDREDLPRLLKENNIDIVLLLAIWPETYSYTLTESLMAEIPVIALDYGALAERISKNNFGWLLNNNSKFEDILKKIDEIFENSDEYDSKLKNIQKYLSTIKTIKAMAKEYEEIYNSYIKKENSNQAKLIGTEEFKSMLKYSKEIIDRENELRRCYENIERYHHTVMEYRKEIDRLNKNIEIYQGIEAQYNHLVSSRKLQLLKKIKFIEF